MRETEPSTIRRAFGAGLSALMLLTGCGIPEVVLAQPGEAERDAWQTLLSTQTDVGSVSVSVAALHVVVSRAGGTASVEVQLTPNARATLPRLGRLGHPPEALAEPGAYLAVSNMVGEIVYLLKVGDGSLTIGEGPTPALQDSAGRLGAAPSLRTGLVVSTRVPLELGGKMSVFTTGTGAGGTPVVEELLAVISFGPDSFPRRGLRYKVEP